MNQKLTGRIPLAVGREDPLLVLDTLNEARGAFSDRYPKQADTGNKTPLPVRTDAPEKYEVP